KRIKTGAVSCTIKPTTKPDGFTPVDRCASGPTASAVSCPGLPHCIDAADSSSDSRISAPDSGARTAPAGGDQPVPGHVPPSYVPGTAVPLVGLLHGYGASGDIQESYLRLTPLADQHGFLYVHPDGTIDPTGRRFWNATAACCNIFGSPVDDS